jgi:predicted kinase
MTTYTSEGKNLYLVRGIPGSGKSTFAKQLGCTHFETDTFFMEDGEYKFDPSKLKQAHSWCQKIVETYMKDGELYPKIAVSNTFTTERELQPYFDLAEKYDYVVFSVIVENRHDNESVHNVSDETINKMINRFQIQL